MKKKVILLFLSIFLSSSIFAKKMIISGTVSDGKDPIVGANVLVKDTENGTITDFDGHYSLSVNRGDMLVISYIGYLTQEIRVEDKAEINVVLKEDKKSLDECIVIGYGTSSGSVERYEEPDFSTRMPYYDGMDDEEYSHQPENRFKRPQDEPLSTFSADVDAASYSNIRRYINQGRIPEPDAVRIEEMINYFSYDLPQPTNGDPVKITTEVGRCPWNRKNRLVRIGLKAKEIPSEALPATNFVFLIDVSGSMEGPTRLDLVKSSLKLLVNNLRDKDRVAIVVYAGAAGQVLPSTSGSDKQKIKEALELLSAGGSTAGGEGIKLAYKTAKKNFIKDGNNRVILCTDGDFNVGVSDNEELGTLIESERKSGVYLTVLGYGMGNYKDEKMQTLAQKGNGNASYIDNIQEANKVLVNEFGSTMYTVAKDVKLQVEFNPEHVQGYRLVGYETRLLNKEDFNDDTKDAGEMGAGHTVTALYEIIPVGVKTKLLGSVDKLKYQKETSGVVDTSHTHSPEMLTVKMRYKLPDEDTSKKIEVPVIDTDSKKLSKDFNFAASVAMFGQLLKKSDYVGNATYLSVASLAQRSCGKDAKGYRREFVRLVESVGGLE